MLAVVRAYKVIYHLFSFVGVLEAYQKTMSPFLLTVKMRSSRPDD